MSAPAAGDAAQTGLTAETHAGAAMPSSGPKALAAAAQACANCGAALSGPYCGQCGQRHEPAIHSFRHFMAEGLEDLTHADSRLWRTLGALLFRPGFLTREFLEGRRARYLPPLRLYLVLSVTFFLIAGILAQRPGAANAYVVRVDAASGAVTSGQLAANPATARQVCSDAQRQMAWLGRLSPQFESSCVATVEDGGRRLSESLLHEIPRAMFLFLPLLGLVMKGLYRRPRRHYVEHVLFFVHNHACLFLLLAASALLGALGLPQWAMSAVHTVLLTYVPVYFLVSMRRVYGQGWLPTAGKLAALSLAYLVLGSFFAVGTFLYAFLFTV